MKRTTSLLILMALLAASAASCGGEATATDTTAAAEGDTTPAVTDAAVTEPVYELPKADFGGRDVQFYIGDTRSKIHVTEETGDLVNDAIYRRNRKVEEQYNCNFKYTVTPCAASTWSTWYSTLEASIMANDNSVDIAIGYAYRFSALSVTSGLFQNLAALQNRYPYNQWQEILGNCDVHLFLGCTDPLTAEFISSRTGEASISVTSKAKQLGTWRISNYTPEYRETSGVGRRKLYTMDEVLRLDLDRALVILRGKNVLEVNKFDYSKHPEAKKLRPSKASSHVPAWQKKKEQAKATATVQNTEQPAPTPPKRKTAKRTAPKSPAKSQIVTTTKDSILTKPKKEE